MSEYDIPAEYIDIFLIPAWEPLREHVREVLHDVEVAHGPIVDIGSGTGLGAVLAAESVPDGEVLAIEPAAPLRAVLMSKIANDSALSRRVSVLPGTWSEVSLPGTLGAALAMNVIGHFSAAERADLLTDLAARLPAGAPLLINILPPHTCQSVPLTRFGKVTLGRRTYTGLGRAEAGTDGSLTWHMTYQTTDESGRSSQVDAFYPWWPVSPAELVAEADRAGFDVTTLGPAELGLHVLRHR